MTYRNTAYAFAQTVVADSFAAASRLPMPNREEPRRDMMTPATIAQNHALHVESLAAELREALAWYADDSESGGGIVLGGLAVATAARALLRAIGEGESA